MLGARRCLAEDVLTKAGSGGYAEQDEKTAKGD
jgi:hypothetical protein